MCSGKVDSGGGGGQEHAGPLMGGSLECSRPGGDRKRTWGTREEK